MNEVRTFYRKCTTCREPITFGADYFRCSVSTCNRKRLTLVFCGLPCWEAHQADARHRDAWAEADRAPSLEVWTRQQEEERNRAAHRAPQAVPTAHGLTGRQAHEILVVVAKLKQYIRDRAQMSTSDRVFGLLSDHLRHLVDRASEQAARDGRRTLLDRDVRPMFERERRSLATGDTSPDGDSPDVLVVVSKLKQYAKARTGMNTSDAVVLQFSEHLRHLCREAIRSAGKDNRRTVMPQDFRAAFDG